MRCGSIPALDVINRSILSRVLWPSGVKLYHTESLAGLNDLHGLRGFWKKLLHSGFRCDRFSSRSFTGQRFEPGLTNILPFDSSSLSSRPPRWFLVANTAPRSLLIVIYFSPLGVCLETSMCFFRSCWFSRPLFLRNRLIKNRFFAAFCLVGVNQCQRARLHKVWQRLPLSEVACALLELFDHSC